MAEGAELRRRHRHASSQVKHDEALHQRARLEDDLPHIVFVQVARFHRARNHIGRHIRRRRPPRPEILWIGAFQAGVSFQITTVPGIKNMIFGGDGIFLASLTGPGRIWLQTLPISKLAHKLMEYMPTPRKEAVQGGVVGGIVGSILDGMK